MKATSVSATGASLFSATRLVVLAGPSSVVVSMPQGCLGPGRGGIGETPISQL
jgi:hypothetical protein